ncbi:MAG: metallophosphatase family protein [Chloroflexi bacterium]|nr:metallophosphatase family protein [Chloroflexota bacterium]MCC6894712.1 metallophosphoesterase family protein [Anaerolineae bacterium]
MILGLISDVHADFQALKRALAILQGQGAEQVICAGDLIDKGNEGDEVVAHIQTLQIPSVMGNHDYMVYRNQQWIIKNAGHDNPMLVSQTTMDYLDLLPESLTFTFKGKWILVAHGSPWSNMEYIYSYSRREVFDQITRFYKTDVVILGHTHEPMHIEMDKLLIVNPGSVCSTYADGSGTCATLSLPDCTFRVYSLRDGERVQPAYRNIV